MATMINTKTKALAFIKQVEDGLAARGLIDNDGNLVIDDEITGSTSGHGIAIGYKDGSFRIVVKEPSEPPPPPYLRWTPTGNFEYGTEGTEVIIVPEYEPTEKPDDPDEPSCECVNRLVPFGVYPLDDDGSSTEEPAPSHNFKIYLPLCSLVIDGVEVPIEASGGGGGDDDPSGGESGEPADEQVLSASRRGGVIGGIFADDPDATDDESNVAGRRNGDFMEVSEGSYWCVVEKKTGSDANIEFDPGESDTTIRKSRYKAYVSQSVESGGKVVLCFKIATISGADDIAQGAFGSVILNNLESSSMWISSGGVFDPVLDPDQVNFKDVVRGFKNCVWMCGGVIRDIGDTNIPGTDGYIALRVGATHSTNGQATLQCYSTLGDLQQEQKDVSYYIYPLYRVVDSKIVADLRNIPQANIAEVIP